MVEPRELTEEEKAEGYTSIVHVRQAGRTPATGWETVDPTTGETIGHIGRIEKERRSLGQRKFRGELFVQAPPRPEIAAKIRRREEKEYEREMAEQRKKEAERREREGIPPATPTRTPPSPKDVRYYKSPEGDKITWRKGEVEPPKGWIEVSAGAYEVHRRRLAGKPISRAELERLVPEATPEEKARIYEEVYKPQEERIRKELERQREVLRRGGIVGRVPVSLALYERAKEVLSAEEMAELEIERGVPSMIAKLTPPPEYAKRPISLKFYKEEITPEELIREVMEERGITPFIELEEVKPLIRPPLEPTLEGFERRVEIFKEAEKEVWKGVAEAPYLYFKGLKEIMTPIGVREPMEFPEKARELFRKPEVQVAAIGSLAMALPLPIITPLAVAVTGYETYQFAKEPTPRGAGRLIFYAVTTGIIVNKLIESRFKAQTSKLSPDKQKRLDEYLKLTKDVQAKSHRNLEPSTIEALRHVKNSKALNKALNDYFIKNPDIVAGGTYGQRTTLKGKAYTGARLPQDGDLYINMKNKEIHTRNIMNIIRRFTDRKVYVKPDGTIMVQNPVGESNAFSFHDLSKLKAKIKSFHPIKGEFWKHYGVIETPDGTKVLNPKYQAEFKISGAMYQRYQTLSRQVKKGKVSKEFIEKKIVQDYADFKAILDSSGIETTVFTKLGKKAAYYGFPPIEYRPAGIPFIYPFLGYPPPRKPPVTPPYPPTRPPITPPYPPPRKPLVTPPYPPTRPPITPPTFITPYPPPKPPVTPPYPPPTEYPTLTTFITPYPPPKPPVTPPYPPPPKPPITPPITRVPEEPEIKPIRFVTKPPKENAYDILIRKGEKRGDKFVKIDEEGLPEHKARRRLAKILDTYIEASGRTRKSNRLTTVPDDPRPPDLSKFRSPVPKSKLPRDTIIELAKHRLDSAKEVQQISYFREQALRKKATLQRQISFIKTQQKKAQLRTRITEQINFMKSPPNSKQTQSGFLKTKPIKFL